MLGRYSKLDPIQIPPEVETYQPPTQEPAPQVHKLDQRLDPELVAALVADYEDGLSSVKLMQRYNLGKGSVLKLLHESGVTIRRPGPQPRD